MITIDTRVRQIRRVLPDLIHGNLPNPRSISPTWIIRRIDAESLFAYTALSAKSASTSLTAFSWTVAPSIICTWVRRTSGLRMLRHWV